MNHTKTLLGVSLVALLSACGNSSSDDIQQWIAAERDQARPRVVPIPEPKQFVPEQYRNNDAVEPFSSLKLTLALKRDASQTTSNAKLVAPELARRKEHLEEFPIDTMSMVGSLVKAGQPVALVKVENLLYQVKLGSYLGQNYGKVTKITETELSLREIVQDSGGEWVERVATLQLQEKSK